MIRLKEDPQLPSTLLSSAKDELLPLQPTESSAPLNQQLQSSVDDGLFQDVSAHLRTPAYVPSPVPNTGSSSNRRPLSFKKKSSSAVAETEPPPPAPAEEETRLMTRRRVSLFGLSSADEETVSHALHALFSVCRVSPARQEQAVLAGAVPSLKFLAFTHSTLGHLAFHLLCDFTSASKLSRATLHKHHAVRFFVKTLAHPLWRVKSLSCLAKWLDVDLTRVEASLLEAPLSSVFINLVSQMVRTAPAAAFAESISKILDITKHSNSIAARFANDPRHRLIESIVTRLRKSLEAKTSTANASRPSTIPVTIADVKPEKETVLQAINGPSAGSEKVSNEQRQDPSFNEDNNTLKVAALEHKDIDINENKSTGHNSKLSTVNNATLLQRQQNQRKFAGGTFEEEELPDSAALLSSLKLLLQLLQSTTSRDVIDTLERKLRLIALLTRLDNKFVTLVHVARKLVALIQ